LPVLLPDLIATTALWLVALAAMLLIFNPTAARTTSAGQQCEQQHRRTEQTVADQLEGKCLLIPKDWTDSDGSGHGEPVF
jgi:hypothetical protein